MDKETKQQQKINRKIEVLKNNSLDTQRVTTTSTTITTALTRSI